MYVYNIIYWLNEFCQPNEHIHLIISIHSQKHDITHSFLSDEQQCHRPSFIASERAFMRFSRVIDTVYCRRIVECFGDSFKKGQKFLTFSHLLSYYYIKELILLVMSIEHKTTNYIWRCARHT